MAYSKTPLFVRRQTGGMFSVVDESTVTGNIFWVDSGSATGGDTVGHGGSPDAPFLTVAYGVTQMTVNNGDILNVMPGHTENIASAGAITCDKAGISIIGIGEGADRPTFTWNSSDNSATWLVTAASVTIKNILGVCGDDSLTSAFVVSAADCELDITWRDPANVEAVCCILTTTDANRLKIKLKYEGDVATGNVCATPISLIGVDNADITVDFYGKASTGIIDMSGTACNGIVARGYFYNSGTTNLTKNMTATIGGGKWFVSGYDGSAGYAFSGGSGQAVSSADLASVTSQATSIATGMVSVGTQVTTTTTMVGSEFTITKIITDKTTIVTAGLVLTGVSSGGELILKRFTLQNDSTVSGGNTGGAVIYSNDADNPLNVSLTAAVFAENGFVGIDIGYPLQTGKTIGIKAVTGNTTGVGSLIVVMTFVRNANGATIAAA